MKIPATTSPNKRFWATCTEKGFQFCKFMVQFLYCVSVPKCRSWGCRMSTKRPKPELSAHFIRGKWILKAADTAKYNARLKEIDLPDDYAVYGYEPSKGGIPAAYWVCKQAKGLAACNSQTASPFGCLNNFYFRILSSFLGSLHLRPAQGFI